MKKQWQGFMMMLLMSGSAFADNKSDLIREYKEASFETRGWHLPPNGKAIEAWAQRDNCVNEKWGVDSKKIYGKMQYSPYFACSIQKNGENELPNGSVSTEVSTLSVKISTDRVSKLDRAWVDGKGKKHKFSFPYDPMLKVECKDQNNRIVQCGINEGRIYYGCDDIHIGPVEERMSDCVPIRWSL